MYELYNKVPDEATVTEWNLGIKVELLYVTHEHNSPKAQV